MSVIQQNCLNHDIFSALTSEIAAWRIDTTGAYYILIDLDPGALAYKSEPFLYVSTLFIYSGLLLHAHSLVITASVISW